MNRVSKEHILPELKRTSCSIGAARLAVIGAGASGMAAAHAARQTARLLGIPDDALQITVLERNTKPGAKIMISGGGKCNVTHAGEVKSLLQKGFVRKNEERFLRFAFHRFSNADLMSLLDRYGVKTDARHDGRVFPVSGRAVDVLDAFRRMMLDGSVAVMTGRRVTGLGYADGLFRLETRDDVLEAASVIVATGGVSWSVAGTTGDGLLFAGKLGHTVVPVFPALAPIMFDVSAVTGLAGVSLRDVSITARLGGETASRRGDMLFTHRGISGPACLSLSRTVAELLDRVGSSVSITADLFPDLDEQMISEILVGYAGRYGSQLVRTFVRNRPMSRNSPVRDAGAPQESCRVPNAFLPAVMKQAGIAFDLPLSGLTRNRRFSLVSALKKMPLGMAAHVPLEQAEVSAGGVSLHDVVPSSMESRLHPNLFFCGEVLDYAGEVGGFNLQAAFSTGWVAGTQAVSRIAAGILRHA